MNSKKYYPYLDYYRAILCIAVLAYHLNLLAGGYLAVCGFFVLSGYLSALSLLKKDNINLIEYYSKRFIKLYLPLVIVTFISICIINQYEDIIWLNLKPETTSILALFNNFWQLKVNADYFARHLASPFMHLWYIAILLQYDLLLPFIILFIKAVNKNHKFIAASLIKGLAILTSALFVYYGLTTDLNQVYYHSLARIFSLVYGLLLALIYFNYPDFDKYQLKNKAIPYYGYLLISLVLFVFAKADSPYFICYMLSYSLISVRIIEYSLQLKESNTNFLTKLLTFISSHSYEIYLVQYPVIFLGQYYANDEGKINTVLIIIITLILAYLLHYIFFKANKVSIILALLAFLLSCQGINVYLNAKDYSDEMAQLEKQLAENEALLKDIEENYQAQLENENANYEQLLAKLSQDEDSLHELVKKLSLVAIGDSVMLGAADSLRKTFPNCLIDAKVSRTGWVVNNIIKNLSASKKLGKVVVLHLGTNGDCPEKVKNQIMKSIGKREVFWVSVSNDKDVHVNKKLAGFCDKYENAHYLDWKKASENHKEYFVADGIHLNATGRKAYSNFIYDSIYDYYYQNYLTDKDNQLAEYENSFNNKMTFIGNELLVNIYNDLFESYDQDKYIIETTDFTSLVNKVNNTNLTDKLCFILDNSYPIDVSQFNDFLDRFTNKDITVITNNNDLILGLKTSANVKLIDLSAVINNNPDYLLFDKIHFSQVGLKAIINFINEHLKGL